MDKLMKDHGGFEHNQQSYRVVTKLEHRYPDFVGLNLTHEVLEGIAKHIGEYDKPDVKDFKGSGHPILEAQIVNFADEIAYLTHDVDDGLTSGLLKLSQLEEVNVLKKMKKEIIGDYPNIPDRLIKYQLIRRLINLFVTDMQEETKRRLSQNKLESLNDVRTHGDNIVGFLPAIKTDISELRSFLFKNLYRHPKVSSMSDMARAIIENLFRLYKKDLELLPKPYQTRGGEENAIERNICDYIAGMTDRFALKEHQRLCE
jgi:dGTPase